MSLHQSTTKNGIKFRMTKMTFIIDSRFLYFFERRFNDWLHFLNFFYKSLSKTTFKFTLYKIQINTNSMKNLSYSIFFHIAHFINFLTIFLQCNFRITSRLCYVNIFDLEIFLNVYCFQLILISILFILSSRFYILIKIQHIIQRVFNNV